MFYYFIFIFMVLIGLFFLNKKQKIFSYFFIGLAVVLLFSFRNLTVGTDTINYVDIFLGSSQFYLYDFKIEPFFLFFNYLIYNLNESVFIYFLIISILWYIVWLLNIEIFSNFHKDISWLTLLTTSSYLTLFNITRQSIAMALSVLALGFLLQKKYFNFMFISLLAVGTHYSSILILLAFILVLKINNPLICFLLSLFFTITMSITVVEYASLFSVRYSSYSDTSDLLTGINLIIFSILKLFLFYYLYYKFYLNDYLYKLFLSLFSIGFSILIVFKFLGLPDDGPVRLSIYFLIFEVFLYPYLFYIIKDMHVRSILKFLFYSFMISVFFYTIYSGAGGLYPYSVSEFLING